MWNKPNYKEPEFDAKSFAEISEENAAEISGGAVGTCYIIGYTCWTTGGWKIGTCLAIGYACNTKKGGF